MTLFDRMKRFLFGLVILSVVLCAAGSSKNGEAMDAIVGFLLLVLFVVLLGIAAYVLLFAFIGRDAKARGLHETASWLTYVRSEGLLGLFVYLFARPGGRKVRCHNCRRRRLASMIACPFCGA